MKHDDWYKNLPLYKKDTMQNSFKFKEWDDLTSEQKNNIYVNMLRELYIDGPVEFYREDELWNQGN